METNAVLTEEQFEGIKTYNNYGFFIIRFVF